MEECGTHEDAEKVIIDISSYLTLYYRCHVIFWGIGNNDFLEKKLMFHLMADFTVAFKSKVVCFNTK